MNVEEFVAHSGNVNCLRIGKKTCRMFITGGDDQKVNLWSIGRPTSLMSLCGHTCPVESVAFDSAEVLVVAGASSGVIKLWDLDETKLVRTLTGHRSYCTAVEFHPFGEFFASGSMDTNLKIWDIRKKGCIHTYKGHTRGISTIRFTPDGRWVVSGGFDNVVKVWDLTAGKLLHDFKFHEGHIRSIEFHPLEFLLATGSADRTVKFWDLETFEMTGSTGRETAGVRSIAFHPDGRTLFCGLDDSLKVFSWEPVICHDSVEMGWSTVGDLCIREGKLLGGAYYQNSVGVWVVDISRIEPYGTCLVPEQNNALEQKCEVQESILDKVGYHKSSKPSPLHTSADVESNDIKNIYVDSENPSISKKVGLRNSRSTVSTESKETSNLETQKQDSSVGYAKTNGTAISKSFVVPNVVPRDSSDGKDSVDSRRESIPVTWANAGISVKPSHIRRLSNNKIDMERISFALESGSVNNMMSSVDIKKDGNIHSKLLSEEKNATSNSIAEKFEKTSLPVDQRKASSPTTTPKKEKGDEALDCSKSISTVKFVNGVAVVRGRTRSLVERFERREGLNSDDANTTGTAPNVMAEDLERRGSLNSNESSTPDTALNVIERLERRGKLTNDDSKSSYAPIQLNDKVERNGRLSSDNAGMPDQTPGMVSETLERTEKLKGEDASTHNAVSIIMSQKLQTVRLSNDDDSRPGTAPNMVTETLERREVLKVDDANTPAAAPTIIPQKVQTNGRLNSDDANKPDTAPSTMTEKLERKGRLSMNASYIPGTARNMMTEKLERRGRLKSDRASTPDSTSVTTAEKLERRRRLKCDDANTPLTATSMLNEKLERRGRLRCDGVNAPDTTPSLMTKKPERRGAMKPDDSHPADTSTQVVTDSAIISPVLQINTREASTENDSKIAENLMENHDVLLSTFRSRLTKLQMVRHFWERNDVKGAINAVRKLPDHSVQADVVSILIERKEIITLDLFSSMLPILLGLLDSKIERHANVSLEMLLKLVAVFGPVVHSAISAPPAVGVDLHAEERIECSRQCFVHLQNIQKILPALIRRGGVLAKCALQLNLLLQEQ